MPDSLARLRTLAEKATPGPWEPGFESKSVYGDLGLVAANTMPADAEFIAACSRDVILALLEVVEAAKDVLAHCSGEGDVSGAGCFTRLEAALAWFA